MWQKRYEGMYTFLLHYMPLTYILFFASPLRAYDTGPEDVILPHIDTCQGKSSLSPSSPTDSKTNSNDDEGWLYAKYAKVVREYKAKDGLQLGMRTASLLFLSASVHPLPRSFPSPASLPLRSYLSLPLSLPSSFSLSLSSPSLSPLSFCVLFLTVMR